MGDLSLHRFVRLIYIPILLTFAVAASANDLRDTKNQADYIVISPTSYSRIAEKLATFRHGYNGFSTMVVNIDSILSQFGASTSPGTARKDFIQYTINSWKNPRPQYFVFAGNINAIPSHPDSERLYLPGGYDTLLMVDQWFVQGPSPDVGIDACLGRFPAWDSTDLAVMVSKTIRYETDSSGAWCNRAISISDYSEQDGDIFEYEAQKFRLYLGSLWNDTVAVDIRKDSPAYLDTAALLNLWNHGAAVVSYFGHANAVQLSHSRYFTTWSVDSLTNGNCLPVCLLGGCDLTYDTGPVASIPTHLLAHKGGGAVAVVSSEGLMLEESEVPFFTCMVQAMIKHPGEPIGKAYEEAMSEATSSTPFYSSITSRITLLGDPALRVKHSQTAAYIVSNSVQPSSCALGQNYPNPFNPTTVIRYEIPSSVVVSLKVYDVLGREVATLADGRQNSGTHSAVFNASGLASGVYFYRLVMGNHVATKKMLFLK